MRTYLIASMALLAVASASPVQAANIVKTAKKAGVFNTLLAAAKAAGLAGALSRGKNLTVFAPTDAAFAKLPKGTVASLLKPRNKHKLAAILKYHVLPRRLAAGHIPLGRTYVRTLKKRGDRTLRLRRNRSGVRVDRARVVKANVRASNGIIHVIDRVLLPSR